MCLESINLQQCCSIYPDMKLERKMRVKHTNQKPDMEKTVQFDVIIIGGSYSGLSAAMALGRALRKTLIIDGGKPCNRQTPRSHNFITHDGKAPREIADTAREQVLQYDTVSLVNSTVINVVKTDYTFTVNTHDNTYKAKKLLLATGVADVMPAIEGFAECWGISVVHCPYCHGYEVRHQKTGIFANGPAAFEYATHIELDKRPHALHQRPRHTGSWATQADCKTQYRHRRNTGNAY